MILIDSPVSGWSHMVSDDIKSLHNFANQLGVNKCWFSNKRNKKQPHYDVKANLYEKAVKMGAIAVSRKELFNFLVDNYGSKS